MRRWDVDQIAFRVDGGVRLGMGHIYRTRILGKILRDREKREVRCFVKEDDCGAKALEDAGLAVIRVPEDRSGGKEPKFMHEQLEERPSLIVMDILNTERSYVEILKGFGHRVVSLEDRLQGATYTNATINAVVDGIENNDREQDGHFYCRGPKYRVLHPDMIRSRKKKVNQQVRRVMVFFGGGDDDGLTLRIVKFLIPIFANLEWDVVLGVAHPEREPLTMDLQKLSRKIRVESGLEHLGEIFSRCDLAILAGGGGSLYEAAYCGVPALAMAKVVHQRKNIREFARLGSVRDLASSENFSQEQLNNLEQKFKELVEDVEARKTMRQAGQNFADGKGLERVLDIFSRVSTKASLTKVGRRA